MTLKIRTAMAALTSLVVFFAATANSTAFAQEVRLDTDEMKYSYAVGTRFAEQLLQQFGNPESGINIDGLLAGLVSMAKQENLQMTPAQANEIIEAAQQAQLAKAAAAAEEKSRAGMMYLEENKAKDGVVVTESGLQYSVMASGDASAKTPAKSDTVVVHYRGTLIDGTQFDSSYERRTPATFPLTGIIPGWQEVLQLMRPGDKWSVVIPSELGYGERGAGATIGPNETLLFEIELLEIKAG